MRCPVCKAENTQGPQCRRCKADLGLLFALEGWRARALAAARAFLAGGQWQQAAEQADEADWLRHGADAQRLLGVASLMGGDYSQAWECYRALRGAGRAAAERTAGNGA